MQAAINVTFKHVSQRCTIFNCVGDLHVCQQRVISTTAQHINRAVSARELIGSFSSGKVKKFSSVLR